MSKRPAWFPEALAAFAFVLTMMLAASVLEDANLQHARVGTLLVFDIDLDADRDLPIRIPASIAATGAHCAFLFSWLHMHPGSLIATSMNATHTEILAHWIGGETAPVPLSCGTQADISMPTESFIDLSRTANRIF